MSLNITDILMTEGKTEQREVAFSPDVLQYGKNSYRITDRSPVNLTITNTGKGKAQITGSMELTAALFCDRCLKDVSYTFSPEFTVTVFSPESEAAACREEDDESLTGYQVDVDELVYNEILVEWPMKILCRPDCKGICSVCGRDLNTGTCGCDTFVPDPRWAAIRDML